MKLALSTVIAIFTITIASPALAAPPESVVIKSKKGDITFPHKEHMKQGCKSCHAEPTGGKIELANMVAGHKLCGTCHEEKKGGPSPKNKDDCAKCHAAK